MKRKILLKPEPLVVPAEVVPAEVLPAEVVPVGLLEQAKQSVSPDRLKKIEKCSVCGGEATVAAGETLCWVCRRLKISAWREIEQQMPMQE